MKTDKLKSLCLKYGESGCSNILVEIEEIAEGIFGNLGGTRIFLYEIQEDFVSFYNFINNKKEIYTIKFK